jgi:hypothetical protein
MMMMIITMNDRLYNKKIFIVDTLNYTKVKPSIVCRKEIKTFKQIKQKINKLTPQNHKISKPTNQPHKLNSNKSKHLKYNTEETLLYKTKILKKYSKELPHNKKLIILTSLRGLLLNMELLVNSSGRTILLRA